MQFEQQTGQSPSQEFNQNTVNPYSAPQADLAYDDAAPDFYVVAIKKLAIMYFATAGIYGIYWFYKNWQYYKEKHNEKMWPIARAIFNVFFVHKLFGKVDEKIKSANLGGENWNPSGKATTYVVLSVLAYIADRLSQNDIGMPFTAFSPLLTVIPIYFIFSKAQEKINISQQDPQGRANEKLTGANWAWIAVGVLIWLFAILGFAIILNPSLADSMAAQ